MNESEETTKIISSIIENPGITIITGQHNGGKSRFSTRIMSGHYTVTHTPDRCNSLLITEEIPSREDIVFPSNRMSIYIMESTALLDLAIAVNQDLVKNLLINKNMVAFDVDIFEHPNDEIEVNRVMTFLRRELVENGISVVITRNVRKGSIEPSGSSSIIGNADNILYVNSTVNLNFSIKVLKSRHI